VVLCMHGWPQNHREFLPVIERLGDSITIIAPDSILMAMVPSSAPQTNRTLTEMVPERCLTPALERLLARRLASRSEVRERKLRSRLLKHETVARRYLHGACLG
jgi:hypothetical protein